MTSTPDTEQIPRQFNYRFKTGEFACDTVAQQRLRAVCGQADSDEGVDSHESQSTEVGADRDYGSGIIGSVVPI